MKTDAYTLAVPSTTVLHWFYIVIRQFWIKVTPLPAYCPCMARPVIE